MGGWAMSFADSDFGVGIAYMTGGGVGGGPAYNCFTSSGDGTDATLFFLRLVVSL